MLFRQLFDPQHCALTYLLADQQAGEAVVIDPLVSQAALIRSILAEHQLALRYVLRTHSLPREGDVEREAGMQLCTQTGAQFVFGHAAPADMDGIRVKDGDSIRFGAEQLQVVDTPGHTPGCISFLCNDRLFCGDVLHINGCVKNAAGIEPGVLFNSVTRKLFRLPGETLVFPAHDFTGRTVSTIAEERLRNAAFAGISREGFITRFHLTKEAPRLRVPYRIHPVAINEDRT